jgi:hypothetical protein
LRNDSCKDVVRSAFRKSRDDAPKVGLPLFFFPSSTIDFFFCYLVLPQIAAKKLDQAFAMLRTLGKCDVTVCSFSSFSFFFFFSFLLPSVLSSYPVRFFRFITFLFSSSLPVNRPKRRVGIFRCL